MLTKKGSLKWWTVLYTVFLEKQRQTFFYLFLKGWAPKNHKICIVQTVKFNESAINFYLITKLTEARSLYFFTRMLEPQLLLLAKIICLSALIAEREKTSLSDTGGVTDLQKVLQTRTLFHKRRFGKKLCLPLQLVRKRKGSFHHWLVSAFPRTSRNYLWLKWSGFDGLGVACWGQTRPKPSDI
jgi:hypothetical protein